MRARSRPAPPIRAALSSRHPNRRARHFMKKRDRLALMRRFHRRAVTTGDSVTAFLGLLEERFDLEPHRIMLADSICRDDVDTIA